MAKQIPRRPEPFRRSALKANLSEVNECSRLVAIQAKGGLKFCRRLPLAAQLQENCAVVVACLRRIWRNMGGHGELAIRLLQLAGVVGENSEIRARHEILWVGGESAPEQSLGPGRITAIHRGSAIRNQAGGLFLASLLLAVTGGKSRPRRATRT